MPYEEQYRKRVALLLRALPFIKPETCFALKGGTAINLFIRDMPRLSVDIDLTYLPIQPYADSLNNIDEAMLRIAQRIRDGIPKSNVQAGKAKGLGIVTKLNVRTPDAQVTIEVTPVLRGCIHDPVMTQVSKAVEESFGFAEARLVSFADLYAGKCVAALDRQHPRDLFDVRDLLANEGIDDTLRDTFIVYLISHNRPMGEVLACSRKPLEAIFKTDFEGMTDQPVSVPELEAARETLVKTLVEQMPDDHKRFLISFERGNPEWDLLKLPDAADMPAVKWRQQNLDTLSPAKRAALVNHLEKVLSGKS